VLTEEQRAEIEHEVARVFERLVSADWFSKADDVIRIWSADEKSSIHTSLPTQKTDAARDELLRARLAAQFARTQTSQSQTRPLEQLVRVIARAVEVLGTSEKALRWINAPVRSLGNQTPVSLLNTPEGIARVEDALGSIEHGVW
jgi:putative toxin-antitoxin system antitoxin component (TIGR02293 family)